MPEPTAENGEGESWYEDLDPNPVPITSAPFYDVGFEAGVRQAIEWLRADYPYGEGPEWREHGCEWIADRLAEHTSTRPGKRTTDGRP